MDGFVEEVVGRLPLAEAVLQLFHHVCEESYLEDVFERHRGRSYEGALSFPVFVRLIADSLMEHAGSGLQSFQRAEERGTLPTTIRAVYGKLSRVPPSVSVGFFAEATRRLEALFPEQAALPVPTSLAGMSVCVHDGKTIKHVAKRLKAVREFPSHVLGGRLVVTQSLSTGLAVAVGAHEDGESGEQPLVPHVLGVTREATTGPRLHVADRQYCDLVQAERFTEDGDHFLVRWNRKVKFHPDDAWEPLTDTDRYGRTYVEEWGWIGGAKDPRRRYVRRVHLQRGKEGEDVILLTDLVEPDTHPADDLLEAYLQRWGIERLFQQVTEVFHLGRLIGTTPRATIFQAVFCLLLYNVIQVVKAYLADVRELPTTSVSSEKVFYDARRQLTAWTEMLDTQQTVDLFSKPRSARTLAARLRRLLRTAWSDRWLKSPSNTHKSPRPGNQRGLKVRHDSVYRLMRKAARVP